MQEAMDDLNPEILDAVMDVTEAQEDGDEITEVYWDTQLSQLAFAIRRPPFRISVLFPC